MRSLPRRDDLLWLAGLLEGEGSFLASPPSSPNNPSVTIQMTDQDVIERVAGLWGVSSSKPRNRSENWKQTYRATVRGVFAVELMKALYFFMGKRRRSQIEKALASYFYPQKQLGERNHVSILTEAVVFEIKKRLRRGESQRTIAKAMNIQRHLIADISAGRSWAWLDIREDE